MLCDATRKRWGGGVEGGTIIFYIIVCNMHQTVKGWCGNKFGFVCLDVDIGVGVIVLVIREEKRIAKLSYLTVLKT